RASAASYRSCLSPRIESCWSVCPANTAVSCVALFPPCLVSLSALLGAALLLPHQPDIQALDLGGIDRYFLFRSRAEETRLPEEYLCLRQRLDADDEPLNRIALRPDQAYRGPTIELPHASRGWCSRPQQFQPELFRLLQIGRSYQYLLDRANTEGTALF